MEPASRPNLASLAQLTPGELRALWPQWFDRPPPAKIRRELLIRALAYRMQERAAGGLTTATRTKLRALAEAVKNNSKWDGIERPRLTPGTHVIREWGNERHQVTVEAVGFVYRGQRHRSLSEIARRITGTRWSGPLFFGVTPSQEKGACIEREAERMTRVRCAVYTRKSSEEGLEQTFNSLDAQREACLSYIESQRHEGWRALSTTYDDGGVSGGTMDRPALRQLLADVEAGRLDTIVVYKVDRLTRSLADFARIVERLEAVGVSFVSVTQQFSTTSSMGRLTLNVLLSFAQFEREVTGERIRDKIAASKRKGMWMGGQVPLGYDLHDRQLLVNPEEADSVRLIFRLYLELKCVHRLTVALKTRGLRSKVRLHQTGRTSGGHAFCRGALYAILKNRLYRGEIAHRGAIFPGQQAAIVSTELWDAVQALLAANNQAKRTGVYARDPSLLAGLLYDDRGHRLTPIHTIRRGKRYRYYVSQAVLQKQTEQQGRVCRIPALEIEQHVTRRLETLLTLGRELLDQLALPSDDTAARTALLAGAKVWKDFGPREPAQVRAFLLATVRRVTVEETVVQMTLSRSGLRTVLFRGEYIPSTLLTPTRGQEDQDDLMQVSISVRLTRCGAGIRLIVPGESGGERRAHPNAALIKAVARAHVWYERLLSGEATSLRAIAREHGVMPRYVRRILRCAFLAPDLVEAILQGRQPPELTLAGLCHTLPLDWAEQRKDAGLIRVAAEYEV